MSANNRTIKKTADIYYYYFRLWCDRKYKNSFISHPVHNGLNTKNRSEKYVVSLTSFPTRINYVWLTIETLMRQSFKPDVIVLWLAEEQFPDHDIPDSLKRLEKQGLTIRYCDDLKSHKKYYYTFQQYPDYNVVLADDDMWYPCDMLKQLVKNHKKYPNDIIASSVQVVVPSFSAMPTEWKAPLAYKKYKHLSNIQAFTGSGTLFPPYWYSGKNIFDKKKIKQLALSCDDLWLYAICLVSNVRTTQVYPKRAFTIETIIPDNTTLFSKNKPDGDNLNNYTWSALVNEFHFNKL